MTHSTTKHTPIAPTTKGHRVWIQNTAAAGWPHGTRFNVNISKDAIHYVRSAEGKRSVTASKGGIIDTASNKVTRWAEGATGATVHITHAVITITRA